MKLKFASILAGILTLTMVVAPMAAQACGNKDRNTSESDLPEGTETSLTVEDDSFAS